MMNDNEAFNKLAEDDGISIKGLTPTDMLLVYEDMIADGEAYFDPVSNSVKLTELGKRALDEDLTELGKRALEEDKLTNQGNQALGMDVPKEPESVDVSNPASYGRFVESRTKPGEEIVAEMTPFKAHLLHMTMGAMTEVGEIGTTIKAHVFYGKELDLENLIEELGDLEFYIEGLRGKLEIWRSQVLDHNVKKLSKRYAKGYSNEAAINRADKEPGQ